MYQVADVGVIRLSDGLHIIRGMPEWREYLEWQKTNTPLPAPIKVPALANRRAEVKRRVAKVRDAKIALGVTFGQYTFDCSYQSILTLSAMLTAFNAGTPVPANLRWRTKDGQVLVVTVVQLRNLLAAMVQRIYQCHVRSWGLMDQVVETSTDPEGEDLDQGWPDL